MKREKNSVSFGIRLNPAVHERLRQVAFDQRVSINALLLEGAELALAARAGAVVEKAPRTQTKTAA